MSKKRPYTHTKKKLGNSWRRPKGLHSKRRLQHKGHAGLVKIGQRGNASQRHKYKEKKVVTVQTIKELKELDKETEAARIPRMGRKKKTPLIKHAQKQNITIVNLNVEKYLQQTKQLLKQQEKNQKVKEEEEEQDEASEDEETEEVEEETDKSQDQEEKESETERSAPTSDNTIPEIKEWLDENNIEYKSSLRKAELLELVEENKE